MEEALALIRGVWLMIPKAVVAAALAAALALSAYLEFRLVYVEHQLAKTQTTLSKTEATLADERTAREREDKLRAQVALTATEKYRNDERAAFIKAQENDRALKKALADRDAAHRRELSDHEQLQRDTEAFLAAAGGGDGSQTCADSLRVERDRSATLRRLFLEADAEAGFMVNAAERHAAEARALKKQLELDRQPTGEQK